MAVYLLHVPGEEVALRQPRQPKSKSRGRVKMNDDAAALETTMRVLAHEKRFKDGDRVELIEMPEDAAITDNRGRKTSRTRLKLGGRGTVYEPLHWSGNSLAEWVYVKWDNEAWDQQWLRSWARVRQGPGHSNFGQDPEERTWIVHASKLRLVL